jgi:methylisocitrate lyase
VSAATPAARLRALAAGHPPLVLPGVYDGLSARLAAAAGFPALVVSGFSVAAARLGLPDYGYLTQTEIAQTAREVCQAVDVPVLVDADTGYGNALSAVRTARLLAAAGAAGLIIEDQEWPKRCGHMAGKRVVAREEWLAKVRAVADLRGRGIDLVLVARTDARATDGLDEAIARARDAHAAGADLVFVEAPADEDELARVGSELAGMGPVANMVEGGRTPLLPPDALGAMGFGVVLWGITGILAAGRALAEAYAGLARAGASEASALLTFTELTQAVGLPDHRALERRYAG